MKTTSEQGNFTETEMCMQLPGRPCVPPTHDSNVLRSYGQFLECLATRVTQLSP